MTIIVETKKSKICFDGPFNICGTFDDLKDLASQILLHLERHPDFSYGWVQIHEYTSNSGYEWRRRLLLGQHPNVEPDKG